MHLFCQKKTAVSVAQVLSQESFSLALHEQKISFVKKTSENILCTCIFYFANLYAWVDL